MRPLIATFATIILVACSSSSPGATEQSVVQPTESPSPTPALSPSPSPTPLLSPLPTPSPEPEADAAEMEAIISDFFDVFVKECFDGDYQAIYRFYTDEHADYVEEVGNFSCLRSVQRAEGRWKVEPRNVTIEITDEASLHYFVIRFDHDGATSYEMENPDVVISTLAAATDEIYGIIYEIDGEWVIQDACHQYDVDGDFDYCPNDPRY